tara:strand:+ start:702 stop:893 length:192 start_codon:yes stop_codon:yes gene_type:complete
MKYKELKEILNTLNDNQLDKDVKLWCLDDGEFMDQVDYNYKGNIEVTKASDQLNDEDETYFVV